MNCFNFQWRYFKTPRKISYKNNQSVEGVSTVPKGLLVYIQLPQTVSSQPKSSFASLEKQHVSSWSRGTISLVPN